MRILKPSAHLFSLIIHCTLFLIPYSLYLSHTKFSAISKQLLYLHLIYSLILQTSTYPSPTSLQPSFLSLKVQLILQVLLWFAFFQEISPSAHDGIHISRSYPPHHFVSSSVAMSATFNGFPRTEHML